MVDVRINGKRFPVLQAVSSMDVLLKRVEAIADKQSQCLTSLSINGEDIDIDNTDFLDWKLSPDDVVDALTESASQLALQSLQVAREMAELLTFDIKVATLNLWDNTKYQQKALETLLSDCKLFLTLGVEPVKLLGHDPKRVHQSVERCLRVLDVIAGHVEDAILLAVHKKYKDSCHVLVARVKTSIEEWLDKGEDFMQYLELQPKEANFDFEYDLSGSHVNHSEAKIY